MNKCVAPPPRSVALNAVRQRLAGRAMALPLRWLAHPFVVATSSLAIAHFAAAGIGLAATVLAARALGPEAFGAASVAIAYPSMIWAFSTAKPVTVATRYLSRFWATADVVPFIAVCQVSCILDIAAAAIAFAIVALTAPWIAGSFYGLPHLAAVMLIYAAISLPSSLSGTNQAILTSAGRFRTLAVLRVLRAVLLLALTATAIVFDVGLTGYVAAVAASQAAAATTEFIAVLKLLHFEHRLRFRDLVRNRMSELSTLKEEMQSLFGWNYALTTLTGLGDHGLLLLLGAWGGRSETAYFRLANSLTAAARVAETCMAKVIYPRLAADWSRETPSLTTRKRFLRWTWRAGVPAALGIFAVLALLPLLIPALFGGKYTPMVFGTQLMFAAVALRVLVFWVEPWFYATGAVKAWTRLHLVQVALLLVTGSLLITHFGFLGGAIAVTLGLSIVPVVSVIYSLQSSTYENQSDERVYST